MSRSHYVYVVANEGKDLKAAFTVKHELISWLGRQLGGVDDLYVHLFVGAAYRATVWAPCYLETNK